MIDIYMACRIAQMEHEERVRALNRDLQLLNDILRDDCDVWVTCTAGHWQLPHIGDILSSVAKGLASLPERLTHKRAVVSDSLLATQERSSLPD